MQKQCNSNTKNYLIVFHQIKGTSMGIIFVEVSSNLSGDYFEFKMVCFVKKNLS